ncbi:MAG: hypothetical protein K6F32_01350 [Bacilli bacterium]|nr:hypothetical protein [Bacilli bacterium]
MVNGENSIAFDNVATPNQSAFDNVGQSDELSVKLPDNTGEGTLYAKNQRVKRASKKAAALVTVAISAGTGGVLITNSFFGSDPKISNSSFSLVDRTFSYSFEITKASKYASYISLFDAASYDDAFYVKTITDGGTFSDEVAIPNEVLTFTCEIYVANTLDYHKTLLKQTYIIQ